MTSRSAKSKAALFFSAFWILQASPALAHSLNGNVRVEGGKVLKNLIVYLIPKRPGQIKASNKTHDVSQKGRKFNPDLIVAYQGDNVRFLNDESREIDHNVYSLSKASTFDLGLGEKGSVLKKSFTRPGRVNFYCSVHKRMEGKLVVLPSPYFAILEKPGAFTLEGIPKGEWELTALVFHRRYKPRPVIIKNGDNGEIILEIVKK